MLYRIFEIVAPICFVVLVAFFYSRSKKPVMDVANTINLDVFVPLLVISVFARQEIDIAEYTGIALAIALVTLLPVFGALAMHKLFNLQWKTLALPMMFKNSGNLGIPLLLLTFGEQYLPAIIIVFIVQTTLHFSVGLWMLSPKDRSFTLLKQPIISATMVGLALSVFNINLPSWLVTGLSMVGDMSVPLMLFSLGVRLVDLDFRGWRIGVMGAIAAPAMGLIAAAIVLLVLDLPPTQEKMVWLFGALPPAIMNFLLAERYSLEPEKMAAIVLFANVGSLIFIPAVLFVVL